MLKQVSKSHYDFNKYMDKMRWSSIWHQLNEVKKLNPSNVLEIGPGPGLFKAVSSVMGIHVETLDIDPELCPDHVGSVDKMTFKNDSFDVVCAFQMLEHLPFEKSLLAFEEMVRVAKKAIIISLPDASKRFTINFYIPRLGIINIGIPFPRLSAPIHVFDGEHYWEIGKKGFSINYLKCKLLSCGGLRLVKTFRVSENPYHRFFIFEKYTENNE